MGFTTDIAVIGSGFGGGVAALRASEAGRAVLVCEQGRRLTSDDLQAGARSARRLLWEPRLGLKGYFRQAVLRDVVILGGIGVGGGSIVYAAVLLEPDPGVLSGPHWAGGVDWAAELQPHYRTAASMLRRQPNPDHGLQDEWLQHAAQQFGVGETFAATPQGIDFERCIRCGQCLAGCPYGAKSSTDLVYLAQAQRLGARIEPRSRAEILVPLGRGDGRDGWRIVLRDPLVRRSAPFSVTAKEVVLAGGVLGTTELLLAGRDRWGTLARLSPMVGRAVRTNSEAFAAVVHPEGTDITFGTAISSDFHPDPATHITNNRLPRSMGFTRLYLAEDAGGVLPAQRRRASLRRLLLHPVRATAPARTRDWHRRTTVLTVMQSDDNALELQYRKGVAGWSLQSGRPDGAKAMRAYLPQAQAAGLAVAQASRGIAYTTLMESVFGIAATAHILGGAVIGNDPSDGVVDSDHEVFGYHGLRVLDGSVVPVNLGVNPSLTITALAERAMHRWLSR